MIWLLLIVVTVSCCALWPVLRERQRKTMDATERQQAPGQFVKLSRGVTHFQWHGPLRGPVAVCVHGLTTPSFVWQGLITGLTAMGFRVLTYDLYGRGYSDRPTGIQDRAFFLTQLEDLLGHEDVRGDFILIGYSMGGAIATAFATAHPDRVRELVLLASAGLATPKGKLVTFIRDKAGIGDWLMLTLFPKLHMRGTEAERDLDSSVPEIVDLQQKELTYQGFIPAVLSSLRGILTEDMAPDLRKLHQQGVPILAIWGQTDDVVPLSAMGRLAEHARSANQEVVEGAGHGLPYTHTPAVLTIIADRHRRGLS